MKIGLCVGLPGLEQGDTRPDMIGLAAETGYDYVEMPLAPLADLDDADFTYVRRRLDDAKINCECLNIFFPAKVRLTGDSVDETAVLEYVGRALSRARDIGAKIVVFGSSAARNVPDGFSYDEAFGQLVRALKIVSGAAIDFGVQIAIEALNKNESNIILSMAEADRLMTAANSPGINILLDYYHFMVENDSVDDLKTLVREKKIIHSHFADPVNRSFPTVNKPEYMTVFGIMKAEGYDARCSIEARLNDPENPRAELESGLSVMRNIAATR